MNFSVVWHARREPEGLILRLGYSGRGQVGGGEIVSLRENDILITAGNIYRRFSLTRCTRGYTCSCIGVRDTYTNASRHVEGRGGRGRRGRIKSLLYLGAPAATLTPAHDIAFLSFDVGRMSIINVIIWMPEGRDGRGWGGGWGEEAVSSVAEFFSSRGETRSPSILSRFIQRRAETNRTYIANGF